VLYSLYINRMTVPSSNLTNVSRTHSSMHASKRLVASKLTVAYGMLLPATVYSKSISIRGVARVSK